MLVSRVGAGGDWGPIQLLSELEEAKYRYTNELPRETVKGSPWRDSLFESTDNWYIIYRSDVWGQLFPIVGKDWSQSGVTDLYTKIANNGYKFAYLSARAIGQAQMTRDYLKSVKQGERTLPSGPVFLNPSSLINAFHK